MPFAINKEDIIIYPTNELLLLENQVRVYYINVSYKEKMIIIGSSSVM